MSKAGTDIGRLISLKEAAKYIDVSRHTLYTWVSEGRIPYVKVGSLTKFRVEQLDAWIKQRTVMPMPEKPS